MAKGTSMSANEVLLITACVNPQQTQDVVLGDPQERLIQYLTSLIAWIKLTNLKTIILCENTNTDYDFSPIIKFAKQEGKTLQVLVFAGNHEAQKFGKGYGEGEIIKYAIENSAHLSDEVNFYKITGRIFLPSFNRFQQLHENLPNVFHVVPPSDYRKDHPWAIMDSWHPATVRDHLRKIARYLYVFFGRGRGRGPHRYTNVICTIFYKSNTAFFKRNLINSYKRVDERKSYVLEHVFHQDLENKSFSPFLERSAFLGIRAGTGELYSGLDYPEEIKQLALSFYQSKASIIGER